MTEERTQRRLAAILAADVVGYGRLMGKDEAGTLAALKERRRGILNPLVTQYEGRIVKLMGDGVLVEFASAVNAVACAIELQRRMSAAAREEPEDRRIVLRVGVNLGDVIVEGSDLYGEGVNLAVRLEALAAPGSVCISGKVQAEIASKLAVNVEDLGEQRLKNIAEPVRVYAVSGAARFAGATPTGVGSRPAKPSIAVLPFTNMSGDSEQQYFSDGVTEDIITELSRFRDLLVIARNSSFQFRGKDIDVRRVGRELDVNYVIEGSIRQSGDRLRITAQLVDAATGNHVWAERYDRDSRDVFALQDEIARSVAATVGGRIEAAGIDRAVRADPASLKAYDLILRVKALAFKYTKEANAQARELAHRAIELDPHSAKAHSYIGYCHMMDYATHWVANRERSLALAYEFEQKAVALDEADIEVRWKFGQVLLAMGRFDDAHVHFSRALEINPNDTEARCQYGAYLDCIGQHEDAVEYFELAKRRNPFDLSWIPWIKGVAYFGARRYDQAIALLNQVVDPLYEVHGWSAASYGQTGRLAEAKAKLEEFLRGAKLNMAVFPGGRLKDWETYWRGTMWYKDQRDFDHLFEGLRKAGLSA